MSEEADRRAAEAARLLSEPLLVEALDAMMGDAFADFKAMRVAPETITDVIALQQRINVLQELPARLTAVIIASGQFDGGTSGQTPTA